MHIEASSPDIAVIGMSCWYPGAHDLRQLWVNILTRRQEFRRIPEQRLPLSEYHDPDSAVPDKTYGTRAAVIDGFEFDWAGKRIPKTVFESTDIVHWLGLEVVLGALEDAGYTRETVPTARSGVVLGNTLTGEHTRTNFMRTRWPYVRRALRTAAAAKGLPSQLVAELVETMEEYYKSVFPPVTEDTLAGGLSNTIAGRICNFLDFHGGGYTVDGACASSLLAVADGATKLVAGDLDLVIVGGVDVSLDTFELIGFAKTGALTPEDMTVYDQRASGFIPGEGCGFVVLKRLEDARADGDYVYAVLRGWGISSDGKGGITAPSREGQAMALLRAYERTGYSPRELDFIEGHGTATPVGDRVELEGMVLGLTADGEVEPRSCGVTSFKSIVGHTKAAAGIGGFIKAVMAVNRRVLPPTAGCKTPNPIFKTNARCLYPILQGELRSPTEILRAGVSGAGFGGINCHLTLESGDAASPKLEPTIEERALLVSNQETEMFVLAASSVPDLLSRIRTVRSAADGMSIGELVDLATTLADEISDGAPVRAAVIAGTPAELDQSLKRLEEMLIETPPVEGQVKVSSQREIWIGNNVAQCRVGFLFPGQGSQRLNMARMLVERYDWAREWVELAPEAVRQHIFRRVDRAVDEEQIRQWSKALAQTEIAQPAICLASLLWTHYLDQLGVHPTIVGGLSLGELTAFHVAGAYDEETLLRLATVRGQAMAASANDAGTMASLACSRETAEVLLKRVRGYVIVANINSPLQVVISGERASVEDAIKLAEAEGIRTHRLPVSNAFHSQLVSDAAKHLQTHAPIPQRLDELSVLLVSSVDGRRVKPGLDLREHFSRQVLAQVDFVSLVQTLATQSDLIVEVGPGRVLSNLVHDITGPDGPICLPVESTPGANRDLNTFLGCLFAHGVGINWEVLYEKRWVRPFVPASERVFIENPCERPFNVSIANKKSNLPIDGGWLESMLAETTHISPQEMSDYFSRRGRFLIKVIEADRSELSDNTAEVGIVGAVPSVHLRSAEASFDETIEGEAVAQTPLAVGSEKKVSALVPQLLLELVEDITRFPQNTLSMDMRLLDDLNLDSMKATNLVADAANRVGVGGRIDPREFANATLAEISEALQPLSGGDGANPPEPRRESWVRSFIMEYGF